MCLDHETNAGEERAFKRWGGQSHEERRSEVSDIELWHRATGND